MKSCLDNTLMKRPICVTCLRAHSACICQWITPVVHSAEVLILQHPMEVDNAKGSARLLHLSLKSSRMVTGEVFDEKELQALLTAPSSLAPQTAMHPVLLHPEGGHDQVLGLHTPPPLCAEQLAQPAQIRLVVIDGTWRKSRKMLYLNPLLQQLPRLSLQSVHASRYRLRKAHKPDQLSTLEAACAALAQLEGDYVNFAPLLLAFDGFVAQQLAYQTTAPKAASKSQSTAWQTPAQTRR
jgi:DTW domain-containing protein